MRGGRGWVLTAAIGGCGGAGGCLWGRVSIGIRGAVCGFLVGEGERGLLVG